MPKQCGVAKLLRSLNDVDELRVNELTSVFFDRTGCDARLEEDAAARAKGAVRKALASIARGHASGSREHRQMRAVVRCDFEIVPHKQVAHELGVGMRQLYRDLRDGRACFERALRRDARVRTADAASAAPLIASLIDVRDIEIQRVRSLAFNGRYADARSSAEAFERGASAEDDRVRAALLRTEALAEDGDVASVERTIHRIEQMPAGHLTYSPAALRARIASLRSRALFVSGDPHGALSAVSELQRQSPARSAEERVFCALASLQSASMHSFSDQGSEASRCIDDAREYARDAAGPLLEIVKIKTELTSAESLLGQNQPEKAKPRIAEAWARALSAGIATMAVDAAMTFAIAEMLAGNVENARKIASEVLGRLDALDLREKPWFIAMAAQVEAAAGASRPAIALLRRAQLADKPDNARRWMQRAFEAEMLFQDGSTRQALAVNTEVIDAFRRFDNKPLLAFSLRVAAQIDERLGDRQSMCEHIRESIELIQRVGSPVTLAKALQLSARMTKNRRHARMAREILAAR